MQVLLAKHEVTSIDLKCCDRHAEIQKYRVSYSRVIEVAYRIDSLFFLILISVPKFENRASSSTFEMEIRHLGNHHGHAEQPRTADLNLPDLFSCM